MPEALRKGAYLKGLNSYEIQSTKYETWGVFPIGGVKACSKLKAQSLRGFDLSFQL